LTNEVDEIETPFILVLDDYHCIHEAAVHDLLSELLRHPPRPMHLVLASRREPSIDLIQLRVQSQVTEVRTQELRFTKEETTAFLEHELRTPVKTGAVEALIGRVEGWAAGLRLITLSLRHRDSVDMSPARRGGDVAYVTDYLMAEVLAGQPPAIQDFLLKTSILDRLNGPLCDAVCFGETKAPSSSGGTAVAGLDQAERNAQAYLERLHQAGLFTIPLDDNREWYRYHYLFRGLLRGQSEGKLGADGIAALHGRASAWFAQNGLINEALRHALTAGDTAAAVELAAQHRHDLINAEQWRHLERWLRRFDRATIDQSPELSIIEAWLLNHHALIQQLSDALDRTARLLSEADLPPEVADPIRGEVHLLRANLFRWFNRASEALAMVEQAKSFLPRQWLWAHAAVSMVYGLGYAQLGKTELAEQTLLADLSDQQIGDNPKHEALLLFALATLYWTSLRTCLKIACDLPG
jgi:LuxR family maltose regulon positive regulatory protein